MRLKTRAFVRSMEERCDLLSTTDGCVWVRCDNCQLNKKYKNFVGIGLDEMVEIPKFISVKH